MNDIDVLRSTAHEEKELADWRPFNVWASQVRAEQRKVSKVKEPDTDTPREKWDPYSVWKRQMR